MNSAIHFVYVVFTLLVFSISSVAEELNLLSNQSRVTLFSASFNVSYVNGNGTREEKQVHSFRIPGLVEVDGVLVAIAEAHYDKPDDVTSIDIVATYSVDNGKKWKTEVIIKNSGVSTVSRVVEPTVVVKGKKIYVLVGSFNKSDTFWAMHYNDNDWDPLLVVGEVTMSTSAEEEIASITWKTAVSLKDEFMKQKNINWILFVGGTRTALLMSNESIVFPLQILKSGNVFPTIMYSNDDGSTWTFAQGSQVNYGSSEPSLVEWGDKLIMSCRREDDTRRFYESSDMGDTWVESDNKLSRVWGNAPDRQGPGTPGSLIAVNIEGMRVMLFILPLNTKKDRNRDRLNLWMTDNNRIFNVGQVSHGDENTGYSSLLYHGDKLYCAHEVNNGNAFSIVLATLDKHLERIKSTVKAWKQNDNKLSDLCIPVDPAASDKKSKSCGENITTSGLVGWLSGDFNDNSWKDVYGCVDAKVTNAIATPYGAKFYGNGSGALWPVSAQGQNRRYIFAENAFTLAAIVSIHKVPEHGKSYPVIGGSWSYCGQREVIALSYNSDRMWVPEYRKNNADPTKWWKMNRKYHVALSLGRGTGNIRVFCAYVDGEPLQCKDDFELFDSTDGIKNFYIGGHQDYQKDMKGYITVSNVMLYNRKLSDNEIMTLSRGKYMIDERTVTISPSSTLSLTPSLSLDPSAHVSETDSTAASPGAGEQTTSAPTTPTNSSSASIQTNSVDEQKGSDRRTDKNAQTALPQPVSTAAPPTEDNTASVPSLPTKPTGKGSAGVDTTPTNSSGSNQSREPNDRESTVTQSKQRTDSKTDTSSSTSTSTSAPVEVPSNSDSGNTSATGLNPSHGADRNRDPSQDKSTALSPKMNNTVSAPSLPVNPISDGGAEESKPNGGNAGITTTNNSGGNQLREPNDSESTVTLSKQSTDSKTDTGSSTSTSTSAPVEVPSNSDSGDTSVTGLNPSHGAENKSDPPQVESDNDKKSSDSPYDDAGRAHLPFTSLLLSVLLGFATLC